MKSGVIMDTIKIGKKNVLMIAHRGVSGIETENTKEAFILAGNRSYYGIETDIHVTKDSKFIVCHDDNILRLTGVDLEIEENNYEDIIKHKLYRFKSMDNALDFPNLTDYINICKKYDKEAILEIKNEAKEEDLISIVSEIDRIGWLDRTVIISFSMENMLNIRKNYKDVRLQFLTGDFDDDLLKVLVDNKLSIDFYFEKLTQEIIDKMHENNLEVNCWTVDHEEDAYKLIDMGVDMITSNILE